MAVDFDALVLVPNMAIFGQPCVWQAAGGVDWVWFEGVFEEFHTELHGGQDGAVIEDVKPVLGARLAELGGLPQNEDVIRTADGRLWTIDVVQPDGNGHVKMHLKRQGSQR